MSAPTTQTVDLVAVVDGLPDGQIGRTFDALARLRGLSDGEIAAATGISRASINAKRNGKRPVVARDLHGMASVIGTRVETLLMPPGQAVKALVDEHPGDFACDAVQREESCGCHRVPVPA